MTPHSPTFRIPALLLTLGLAWALVSCASNRPRPDVELPRAPASAHAKSAQASRTPWGGYWWSMLRGELVLGWDERGTWTEEQARKFDGCIASYTKECVRLLGEMTREEGRYLSPLMKYDYYVRLQVEAKYGPNSGLLNEYSHAVKWELDNHYIGDNQNHKYWDTRGFAGKCIGWALANFEHAEPTETRVLGGVRFEPADLKGLLAAVYNGAQFFTEGSVGTEYNAAIAAGPGAAKARADVSPKDLILALQKTIDKKRLIEADLDPDVGVWNYPVHAYDLAWDEPKGGKIKGKITLSYANDEVEIEQVFSKTRGKREDIISRELEFEMKVPEGFDGDFKKATASEWKGDSVDRHPDALILGLEKNWMDKVYDYRGTDMKQALNFALMKRVRVGGKWIRVIDGLLADYYAPSRAAPTPR